MWASQFSRPKQTANRTVFRHLFHFDSILYLSPSCWYAWLCISSNIVSSLSHSFVLLVRSPFFLCVSPRMPRNIVDERDEREIERERARQEYDGSWTFATSKAVSNNDDDDGLMTITIHSLTHFKIKIIKFRQSFSSWTFPIVLLNNRSGSMAQTATVFAPYIVWNKRHRIF